MVGVVDKHQEQGRLEVAQEQILLDQLRRQQMQPQTQEVAVEVVVITPCLQLEATAAPVL